MQSIKNGVYSFERVSCNLLKKYSARNVYVFKDSCNFGYKTLQIGNLFELYTNIKLHEGPLFTADIFHERSMLQKS